MKKKIKVVTHGNQWIDTIAPIVCPECASLDVKKYKNSDTNWSGPFHIKYERDECLCKTCNCRFVIGKERKSICDVSWDEIWFIIASITIIIFILLLAITVYIWGKEKPPALMVIAISSDFGLFLLSFLAWIICS